MIMGTSGNRLNDTIAEIKANPDLQRTFTEKWFWKGVGKLDIVK